MSYIDFQLLRMRLRQKKTYTSAKIMAKGLFLNRKYYDVWLDLPLVTACCKGFEEVLEQADQKKNTLPLLDNAPNYLNGYVIQKKPYLNH